MRNLLIQEPSAPQLPKFEEKHRKEVFAELGVLSKNLAEKLAKQCLADSAHFKVARLVNTFFGADFFHALGKKRVCVHPGCMWFLQSMVTELFPLVHAGGDADAQAVEPVLRDLYWFIADTLRRSGSSFHFTASLETVPFITAVCRRQPAPHEHVFE